MLIDLDARGQVDCHNGIKVTRDRSAEDALSGPDVGADVHEDADDMDGLSSQMRGTSIQEGEIQSTQLPSRPREKLVFIGTCSVTTALR